eukprot:3080776-Prymnesium_polylepis.1
MLCTAGGAHPPLRMRMATSDGGSVGSIRICASRKQACSSAYAVVCRAAGATRAPAGTPTTVPNAAIRPLR